MTIGRAHTPLRRKGHVECVHCGMRQGWAGWKQACTVSVVVAPQPGTPEYAAHLERVKAWKLRNPDRVKATAERRNATRRAEYAILGKPSDSANVPETLHDPQGL